MSPLDKMIWKGSPIMYKRTGGIGLIIGKSNFKVSPVGDLMEMAPLTRMALEKALEGKPNAQMQLTAHASTVNEQIRKQKRKANVK